MKVTHVRLVSGCHALKSRTDFVANKTTSIERMVNGDYLVKTEGKIVMVPSSQVKFAEMAEETASVSKVPVERK